MGIGVDERPAGEHSRAGAFVGGRISVQTISATQGPARALPRSNDDTPTVFPGPSGPTSRLPRPMRGPLPVPSIPASDRAGRLQAIPTAVLRDGPPQEGL